MKEIFLRKKGNLEPALLVFSFFALVITSLFVFNTSSSAINIKVNGADFLDSVYVKADLIEYYISETGKKTITTLNFSEDKAILKNKFDENFKKEIVKYKFEEYYLINFQNKIKQGDFVTSANKDKISIWVVLELESEKEGLKVVYTPAIKKEFELK